MNNPWGQQQPITQQGPMGGFRRGMRGAFGDKSNMMATSLGLMFGQNPQQQMQAAQNGLMNGGQIRAQNAETQKAEQQRNATMEYFKANRPDLAAQVQAGMPMSQAWSELKAQPTTKPTSAMQNWEYGQENPDFAANQLAQKKAGAQNITIGGAQAPVPEFSKLPAGYVYKRGPDGQILIDESGVPVAVPITDGPKDMTQFNEKKAAGDAQKATVARTAIQGIKDQLNQGGMFNLPEVGIIGSKLAGAGLNQEAVDVSRKLQTIQSIVSFDRLQQMRDSSPTGGALGAVSERELALLQSSLGALSNDMSQEDLIQTLDFIDGVMKKFEAYPGQEDQGEVNDFSQMSDEELEAIANGR